MDTLALMLMDDCPSDTLADGTRVHTVRLHCETVTVHVSPTGMSSIVAV